MTKKKKRKKKKGKLNHKTVIQKKKYRWMINYSNCDSYWSGLLIVS